MKRAAIKAMSRWMGEHDWTQQRVAAYAGCSQGLISQIMRGTAAVSLEVGLKLAELTGIPLEDIVTDRATQRILESYVNRLLVKRGIAKDSLDVA